METRDLMPQLSSDSSFLLSVDAPRVEFHTVATCDRIVRDIQSRPVAAAPATVIRFCRMHDRLWTYQVKAGPPDTLRLIGYVRWTTDDTWIARTLGSETAAASIRTFVDRVKAAEWLWRQPAGRRR